MEQYMQQPTLFQRSSLRAWLEARYQTATQVVNMWDGDVLLQMSDDDVVEFLLDGYGVICPVLDQNGIERDESEERYLPSNFGNNERLTLWRIYIPFTGHDEVFYLDNGFHIPSPLQGNTETTIPNAGHLLIDITSNDGPPKTTPKMIHDELDRRLTWIERSLGQARSVVDRHNVQLRQLQNVAQQRRQSVLADRAVEENIGIPVRRRVGSQSLEVPVTRKTVRVTRSAPAAKQSPSEPRLGEETYAEILRILGGSALQLERTPDIAEGFGEEDIRNLLLMNLNGQLELVSGGEMFNHDGKTDILVREGEKNVFIGECKVWDGSKVVTDGVTQLFTYLAWRDTRAAFLLFIRKGEPTDVIAKSIIAIQGHELYKRDVTIDLNGGKSDFIFRAQDDEAREVKLAFLPFVLL